MAAASKDRRTGPVVSLDVPILRSGAKTRPLIGQRSPVDRPDTAPMGNSDRRVAFGISSTKSAGARKQISCVPRIMQRCAGWRTKA